MEKIGTIISTVLYALAMAIGVIGAIMYYMELEFFGTDTAILLIFVAVFFVALAGLNSVDRDWLKNVLNLFFSFLIYNIGD